MRSFSIRRVILALLLVGGVLAMAPAHAQQKQNPRTQAKNAQKSKAPGQTPTALAVVPEGALGFGVIRNLGELDEKISGLAKELQIATPGPLLTMIRGLSGIQEGLDDNGSVVAAILPPQEEDAMPVTVMFVPVSDYQKFVAQLRPADAKAEQTEINIAGQDFSVMRKGNYAALAAPRDAARLKEIVAARSGSLGLPERVTSWVGEHDAYAVVMPEGVKRAIRPIREGLKQAKGAFPPDNQQLQGVAAIFEFYDKIFSTIELEVTHFAAGLRIDQGNVYLNSHSTFIPTGSLAQAAKDVDRAPQGALSSLTAGPYVFAVDGVFPESWFKGMSKFSAEMMRMMAQGEQKLSDEEIKKLSETMQQSMVGVNSMAFRFGPLQRGKSLYASMTGAFKVESAKQYLAKYEATVREMAKVFEKSKNPVFGSYELSKGESAGVQTLQVSMDMSAMIEQLPDPNAKRLFEMMIGEGGKVNAYLAAADNTTVVLTYDKQALNDAIQTATKKQESLADQPEIERTTKLLPAHSQWRVFISPSGVVQFGGSIVQMVAPGGPGPLPPFPNTPPVGLGVLMTAQGWETSLVVPKDVLAAIGNYSQQMMQGRGAQQGVNGVPPPARPIDR